jgi:malonate-semialdehyde dehydrogenase (acetylating)/methylmalonate-semialdehyde dehydrogenase
MSHPSANAQATAAATRSDELVDIPHWIDGVADTSGEPFPVINPATGDEIGRVFLADQELVDRAVAVAAAAFPAWSATTPTRRAAVMHKFRALLMEHTDELAAAISAEHGKTIDDARGEVARGLEAVELAAAVPFVLKGELSEQTGTNIDTFMAWHPLGVCVGITPFNFPVMIPLMMLSVALASGNTFILKPSEQDPGPTLLVARLAAEAGVPAGVLTVLHGRQDTVERLIDHPDTAAVSFVGSTPVARAIYSRASQAGKRVQAMGGAKNHLVVAPDANLDAVADALSSAAFGSAGQRCMAVTTAVVVGDVADALAAKMRERAMDVIVGNGADAASEMGPVISLDAQARIRGFVERAIANGATAVVDRSAEPVEGHERGSFVGPVVLDEVDPASEIYQNEVFGPVLILVRVETFDEALELVRTNRFGNGASLFTRSGLLARRFQREAQAGMVGINVPIPVPVAAYSVAGWKDSVFGDTGLNNGSWRFYNQPKYVTSRWDESTSGVDLGFRPN